MTKPGKAKAAIDEALSIALKNIVHLFDGIKGGVGKSFVCIVAIQYLLDKNLPFVLLEADRYNPDLARRYGRFVDLEFAVFSDDPNKTTADALLEYAKEKIVVVSLPSQVDKPIEEWLEDGLEAAENNGIKFVRWFVTSGSFESRNLLRLSLKKDGAKMQYLVVKNFGLNKDWSFLDVVPDPDVDYENLPEWDFLENHGDEEAYLEKIFQHREAEAKQLVYLMRKYKVQTIDFPEILIRDRNLLDECNLTFRQIIDSKFFKSYHSAQQERVKKFLLKVYAQFESTGLI